MKRKCKYCGDEVARTLGAESSPHVLGYCSTQCYTKATTNPRVGKVETEQRVSIGRRLHTLLTEIKKTEHPNQKELIAIVKTIREEFHGRKTGGLIPEETQVLNVVNKTYKNLNRRVKITGNLKNGVSITAFTKSDEQMKIENEVFEGK